jgi:uncharacterized protein (TIGR02001 family)
MKKLLVILTACAIANPLQIANAATTKKIHHKKKHHHVAKADTMSFKDAASTTIAKDAPAETTWLSNLSGTVGLTSNYMFRGISLSQDNPAVQGGFTYTFPIGLYLSTWGSNANYTVPDGKTATSELDAIIGVRNTVGENFTYDINFDRYNYPGARYGNYNELNTLFIYRVFQLGVSYTSNYSGYHSRGLYTNGTITLPIPAAYIFKVEDVTVSAEMGHYSLSNAGGISYNDYSIGLNKKINNTYSIAVLGTGTNGRAKNPPFDGNQIVGTLTAVF